MWAPICDLGKEKEIKSMKIKRKVQKTLPQLIEYAWDNDMRNKNFESEGGAIVYFDYDGNLTCARGFVPQDFFTVTTEEEITEDTEFECLIEKGANNLFYRLTNSSIDEWKDGHSKEFHAYIDGEFKCIWRDGKLVG